MPRQEDLELEASLGYTESLGHRVGPCLTNMITSNHLFPFPVLEVVPCSIVEAGPQISSLPNAATAGVRQRS